MKKTTTLLDELSKAIHPYHVKLEKLPFAKCFVDGFLPLESYVSFMRCFAIIQYELERSLTSENFTYTGILDVKKSRMPYLMSDIDYFKNQFIRDIPTAIRCAFDIAMLIKTRLLQSPVSLLGYLYVLEGSRKGGLVLAAIATRTFSFPPGVGVAYLTSGGVDVYAHWESFSDRLNEMVSPSKQPLVIGAAVEIFVKLVELFTELYPFDSTKLSFLASGINFEAGDHAIPNDFDELNAAIVAGERCLQKYTYFERRYGERGKRFTSSDSAWLVTLCRLDQHEVDSQTRWLGSILAARGIPRFLLEEHLRFLYEELMKVHPERHTAYYKLMKSATDLGIVRRSYIDYDTEKNVTHVFCATAGDIFEVVALPEAPALLISALSDEHDGVKDAMKSLLFWLKDPKLFPPIWIQAVEAAIQSVTRKCDVSN